jgi:ATP-dependent DNA helicase DinG
MGTGHTQGDLAELPGLDERSALLPHITSSRDNCLGAQCPKFRACHVNLARREAMAADVVVINHHLFFADLAVRESGMAELLPTVQTVVFDEAHQLNETGLQFLGRHPGHRAGDRFAHATCWRRAWQLVRGLGDWQVLGGRPWNAPRATCAWWSGRVPPAIPAALVRHRRTGPAVDPAAWQEGTRRPAWQPAALQGRAGGRCSEQGPDFVRLGERLAIAECTSVEFFRPPATRTACAGSMQAAQLRLIESPLDIAQAVQDKMLRADATEPDNRRSWIFTSATLGDDPDLRWFTEPCGLAGAHHRCG